jgi:Cu+-exporting ATPase
MASSPFEDVPTADEERDSARRKETAHMATTTLKVEGMTCGACTSAVEAAFTGVEGAGAVSVSLVMGRAVVHHDPVALPPEKVAELIEDRGFDAQVLSTDMPSVNPDQEGTQPQISTTTVAVEGMTCGACTSAVEGGLKDVLGVKSVSVSLLSERAVVEHDASLITPGQVAEIIEDRGFGATVLDTKAPESAALSSGAAGNKSQLMSTTVSVEGMTCGACTSSVTNAFKDVEGVIQFDISLLAERAVVVHDPLVLPPEKITEIIEDAGFDARVINSEAQVGASSKSSRSIRLSIYGLRDAVSAVSLEDLLRQKNGVISVSINFSTSRASIVYNSAVVGIRSIVEAIEAAGYNALVSDSEDNNAQLESLSKTKEIQEWRRAFRVSLSFAIPVFLISMIFPMYIPVLDIGKFRILPGLYLGDLLCLLLTIPVQFGIGMRFYVISYKALKHRAPTMDVLVMLGTSAAFFFSVFTMVVAMCSSSHMRPSTVFDTSTMLITFITLGRWLENRAKGQTSKALSRLMSLTPSMATIYEDPIAAEKAAEEWSAFKVGAEKSATSAPSKTLTTGQKVIPTELIQVGDVVVLRPGDKVSADGVVIRGESYVDESMITGEARPINKKKGSLVIAGTVNGAGSLDFKVTRAGSDTQLSQIVKLVQDAQTSRAPIQRMADVVAGYFVPVIILLGLLTFVGWMLLSHILPHPPKIFDAEGNGGKIMVCLKLCISVIVFACPCALGLSTPTAVMVGTGVGAEHGILVKGGAALEAATKINHVVFDKTGTLTEGKMSVAETRLEPTWSSNEWRRRLWWLIVGLGEMSSEHPVAKAIVAAAKEETLLPGGEALDGSVGDFEVLVGRGVSATVEPASGVERTRYRVLLGNAVFLHSNQINVPEWADPASKAPDEAASAVSASTTADKMTGMTLIHVAIDGHYTGTISLRDSLKHSAVAAVAALHRMGLSTSLVTGDTYPAALAVARAVGIPVTSVRAGVSPAEKKSIVASYQSSGDRVAMIGDGINDSPALASAYVGIALASGTDVAMEAADIVLMRSDDLLAVPASLSLARAIFNRIKLNLLWACVYNVIGLPFAMGIFLPFGGITLHPMAAGAAMAASSVSVVCSSLLLKFWRRPRWMTVERLEKEAAMGLTGPQESRKTWWKNSPFTNDSSGGALGRSFHDFRTMVTRTVLGRRSRQAREEEGYVPLQTVEP